MSVQEFQISTFSSEDLTKLEQVQRKQKLGRRMTSADLEFEAWYELEAQQQYEARELLKEQGWHLVHYQFLKDEERLLGMEMICYAHWHRAFNAKSCPVELMEYAGCWGEATAPLLFHFPGYESLLALWQKQYPVIGRRRLMPGYTYVWAIK